MKDLSITELRKKNLKIGFRISEEERNAIEQFCQKEQISLSDFFRLAIRKVTNQENTK
ncbi:hypothetical protein [uncultured Draconibacterium sp.]|uniref:plasmid mobilization protein n=1 Tax=uncultured Draconibacterium sp. TaxID=1573823 RepID=UPI0025CFFB62|nr:hypothetical protein [uncultured Draconibacterium sp.]